MAGMQISGPVNIPGRWDNHQSDYVPVTEASHAEAADGSQEAVDPCQQEVDRLDRLEPRIKELEKMDKSVREHEQIHKAVAGPYAGEITYRYVTGPDGKRYAVGGSTPIAAPQCRRPEDTIRAMEKVRQAALAPGDPSPEDLRMAELAMSREMAAREAIRKQAASGRHEISDRVMEKTDPGQEQGLKIVRDAAGHIKVEYSKVRDAIKRTMESPGQPENSGPDKDKADTIGEAYRMAMRLYRREKQLRPTNDRTLIG